MKRKVLVLLLLVAIFIVGCTNTKSDIVKNENVKSIDLQKANPEELVLPISQKPLKLTMATNKISSIAGKNYTYGEIEAFKELEKRTGIQMDYQYVSDEKVNLMFASDDLPDLLLLSWGKIGGALKYAKDDQIIKLDDVIGKYAPNFVNLLKENKLINPQLAEADGLIHYFPFIRGSSELRVFQGFQLRQDWLDKLGIKMPTTREDFYNTLKAFKERDPNGNGKRDEIPYVAEKTYGIDRMFNWWGMDAFYVDNGTIKSGWLQPEYKDYIIWLNKLYKEGLIDPDYAITDKTQFDSKVSNKLAGAWYGLAGGTLGRLTSLMKTVDPSFQISAVPWLLAPDNNKYVVNSEFVTEVSDVGIAITTKCKNVKEAVKWADYAYSQAGNYLLNFGIEGVSYTMKDGIPTYTDLVMKSPKGLPVSEAINEYAVPFGYPMSQNINYFNQYMIPIQKAAINIWKEADASRTIPNLKHTEKESDIVIRKFNEINSYNSEMLNKFITGKESLDNYDKYLVTIKNMGIEDIINVKQQAYDRYLGFQKK